MSFGLVLLYSSAHVCVNACRARDGNQGGHWDVQLNALIQMAVHNVAGGRMMTDS